LTQIKTVLFEIIFTCLEIGQIKLGVAPNTFFVKFCDQYITKKIKIMYVVVVLVK